jgi:hypothetical protein
LWTLLLVLERVPVTVAGVPARAWSAATVCLFEATPFAVCAEPWLRARHAALCAPQSGTPTTPDLSAGLTVLPFASTVSGVVLPVVVPSPWLPESLALRDSSTWAPRAQPLLPGEMQTSAEGQQRGVRAAAVVVADAGLAVRKVEHLLTTRTEVEQVGLGAVAPARRGLVAAGRLLRRCGHGRPR